MRAEPGKPRRPSRLVVGLLFFFALVAPSPIWPALGLRGFMLLAGLLSLLLAHLLRSGRSLDSRLLVGLLVLFVLAAVPSFYWGDMRLALYPMFFASSALLVSQATRAERDAFITLSTLFLIVLLVGAVIGYALAALGLPPLGSFDNTDGRPNYVFYTTFTNSYEDNFIRPSGLYDEPGAFSFFVCMMAYLRHATGRSRAGTLALLSLGLITFSITHMIFLVLYIVTLGRRAGTLVRVGLAVLATVAAVFAVGGREIIENKVLTRLVINDDGNLAGDTRSMLMLNAALVLFDEDQAALVGADSSCTLDASTCMARFGPMGENVLSPLVSQGLFLSWPYYLFLLTSLAALFTGRRGLMFFAVGLLFVQRPYLLNLGYSVLGVLAWQTHLRSRSARLRRSGPDAGSTMDPVRFVILPAFSGVAPGFYSFMGPVAYYTLRQHRFTCHYYCDGMLTAWLFSRVLRRPVTRTSFDYGSIAGPFLQECERRGLRLLVMGGKPAEAEAFGTHLAITYPALRQQCVDGYPANGFSDATADALRARLTDVDVLLLAMGSPLQEHVGQKLVDRGYRGTVITAGAFVTQTVVAGSRPYYPRWINRLNLRFLWRLIHEPHTRSRFKYVFSFPVSCAIDRLRDRVQFQLPAT